MTDDLELVKQFHEAKIDDLNRQMAALFERRFSLQEALDYVNDLIKVREQQTDG